MKMKKDIIVIYKLSIIMFNFISVIGFLATANGLYLLPMCISLFLITVQSILARTDEDWL